MISNSRPTTFPAINLKVNSNFSMFTMTIWLCEDLLNEFLKFPLFFELWLNHTNCHLFIKIKTKCKNIASKFSNDYFLVGSFKILPSKPFTKPDSHCKLRKPRVFYEIKHYKGRNADSVWNFRHCFYSSWFLTKAVKVVRKGFEIISLF